ncbi:MAG: phosphotransferase [Desulfarculus sp.]|nr:phosphotransferase [Desulfarculus sp.]
MLEQIAPELARWARANWPGGDPGELAVEAIAADGSPRAFWRLRAGAQSLVLLHSPDNPPENRAWQWLAGYLGSLGLPVARVLAAQAEAGRFLMEDLGATSLQEAALALAGDEEALAGLYEPVLAMLAHMQARGAQGLDQSICFDGPKLTAEFLLEREAHYFLREFVLGACGLASAGWPANLLAELTELCRLAARARPLGFVHRDFQSRNLLVRPNGLGLVDFQGGRLGPAQYDLAALVNDPYVDLPQGLRRRLVARYLKLRAPLGGLNPDLFMMGWPYVALSRAMQTLGAFAFLTRARGRGHFAAYVTPALATLRGLAALPEMESFPAIQGLVAALPENLAPEALRPLEGAQA